MITDFSKDGGLWQLDEQKGATLARNVLNRLYLMGGWCAALFLMLMCGIVVLQVLCNLVIVISDRVIGYAVEVAIPSYADFAGFFFAASAFFGLAYTFRKKGHVRVSILIDHLSPLWQRLVELWCLGVATALSVYLAINAVSLVLDSYHYGDMSGGLVSIPIWIPQLAMAAGVGLLSLALVDAAICLIADLAWSAIDRLSHWRIARPVTAAVAPKSLRTTTDPVDSQGPTAREAA